MRTSRRRAIIRKTAVLLLVSGAMSACDRPAVPAWSWSGSGPSRSGLLPVGDGVVFGNEAGDLVRLHADGSEVWRVRLSREIASTPTLAGETVVAATVGGEWIGVELASGRELWRLGGKPEVTLPLASDGRRAFAVQDDGAVVALSAASGGTAWKRVAPRALRGTRAEEKPLRAAPSVQDGRLLVGLGTAGLYALQPSDGDALWRRELGEVVGFLAEGARIYAATAEGRLFALDAATGRTEWSSEIEGEVVGGPWLARGLLWVALGDRAVASIDPQDGRETWRTTLPAPLGGGVSQYRELVLLPTNGPEGHLWGVRPGRREPVFDLRIDSRLRSRPLVFGATVLVLAADGRVTAWEIRRTSR